VAFLSLVLGFVPIALLLWAWVAGYERRPFRTLGFERREALKKLLRGVLLGVGTYAAVVALPAITGGGFGPGGGLAVTVVILAAIAGLVVVALRRAARGSSGPITSRG
jgi:hypothetical protein